MLSGYILEPRRWSFADRLLYGERRFTDHRHGDVEVLFLGDAMGGGRSLFRLFVLESFVAVIFRWFTRGLVREMLLLLLGS